MDTELIRRQTQVVDAARKAVAETVALIETASAKHGQDCADVSVNGVRFNLVVLNRGYMPEVAKGMEAIQAKCLELLRMKLHGERSRLEGAEWKLRQLIKPSS